jgi:hypothetical protein
MVTSVVDLLLTTAAVVVVGLAAIGLLFVDLVRRELLEQPEESPDEPPPRADQDVDLAASKNGSRPGGSTDSTGGLKHEHPTAERRRRPLDVLRRSRNG